ncbi:hypothetical protein PATSB16_07170 [Pandoraea thiooxydans]|nr:hypothetical protein PATSB16_07170 [Pandoraea thiooxydans]
MPLRAAIWSAANGGITSEIRQTSPLPDVDGMHSSVTGSAALTVDLVANSSGRLGIGDRLAVIDSTWG